MSKLSTENVTIDADGVVRLNLKSQKVQAKVWEVIRKFKNFPTENQTKLQRAKGE